MPLRRLRASFGQHRLLGGAFVLALTQLLASVAGLLRDYALNRTYPGLSTVDIYIASFRPSDLLFQITIMAGLSTVLVPLLARYKAHDQHEETSRLLSSVMLLGSLAFGLLAVILAVVFPSIAPSLVGFQGEDLVLYIRFGQIALLTNFLFVCGNALGQYLVTVQRYWIYGLTPILYTAGTVLGTLFLSESFGSFAPMIGTVAGACIYVLIRLVGAMWAGLRPSLSFWHPDLKKMGWLMLPRMAALGALQLELLLFDALASGLPAGSVTINANARNFQSAVVGVIGIALAQSSFALLSNAAARREVQRFWTYIRKGVFFIVLLTIPSSIALVFLAPVAAMLVHLQSVLPVFGIALALYAVSIPFESLNHLLLRSFYALHVTAVPAVMNVLNGLAAIAATWFLLPHLGVFALPIGFAAGQIIQLIGLAIFLSQAARRMMQ